MVLGLPVLPVAKSSGERGAKCPLKRTQYSFQKQKLHQTAPQESHSAGPAARITKAGPSCGEVSERLLLLGHCHEEGTVLRNAISILPN